VFYDIFHKLCKDYRITPAKVGRDLGINQSTISMWKSQGATPNAKTVTAIADYFRVKPDYLLGNERENLFYDGKKISIAMVDFSMNNKSLAENLGISEREVAQYRCGKIPMYYETLKQLASILGGTPPDFYASPEDLKRKSLDGPMVNYVIIESHKLSDEATKLVRNFEALNDTGRRKAQEYITDLTEQAKYSKGGESDGNNEKEDA